MNNYIKQYLSHYKTLITLGLPIVVGQLGIIILSFADTMMIGQHSTNELAAASFVNNIFNLAIIFSVGFSYGLTPVVGMFCGRGEKANAGFALRISLMANLVVSFMLSLLLLIVYQNIDNFDLPHDIIPIMRPYFVTLLTSIPFVMLFNAYRQFTDGITMTKVSMWILLIGNAFNIIGNYVLIYGKLGLPELGLYGAGISTLASRVLMVVVFSVLFFFTKTFAQYKRGFMAEKWSTTLYKKLNKLGLPIALQMGMESASFNLSTVMVGWIGTIALASHQVMLTVSQFTFMIYYGIGAAIAVRVSHYAGINDKVNISKSTFAGLHLMLLVCLIQSTAIFLLKDIFPYWFTDDVDVVTTTSILILPFLLYQVGDTLQITFANSLRGMSDVKPMMYIAFVAYFIISLPLGYVFGFLLDMKLLGIWLSFPFGLTSAGLLLYIRFRKHFRNT